MLLAFVSLAPTGNGSNLANGYADAIEDIEKNLEEVFDIEVSSIVPGASQHFDFRKNTEPICELVVTIEDNGSNS